MVLARPAGSGGDPGRSDPPDPTGGGYVDPETGQDISIARYAIAKDWQHLTSAGGSHATRRYLSSALAHPDRPAPTITASGGGLSTASLMHPTECRKHNLVELRRLCGFPDDYVLTGTYAERWARLGNSVPPPIMAAVGAALRDHVLQPDQEHPPPMPTPHKPPYRVPLVAETAAAPRNGLKVASTFTGGGGSCYGYELAGYEVVWANEVVQAARETYAANHPRTILDGRDIRTVQPGDILTAAGLDVGELDLFDGSPPCQSFSTSGKRDKGWGKTIAHSDGTTQVADDLFFEYARLLRGLQPRTFVAENVSGLVKGSAKGYFKLILRALRDCGYRVSAQLLDAQWLGVPQARQRIIFIGVREDLGRDPVFPVPLPYRYTVADAIGRQAAPLPDTSPALTATRDGAQLVLRAHGWFEGRALNFAEEPTPTVLTSGFGSWNYQIVTAAEDQAAALAAGVADAELRRFSIPEIQRCCGFPDDYALAGSYADRWTRVGNAVPPPMMAAVAAGLRDGVLLQGSPATAAN